MPSESGTGNVKHMTFSSKMIHEKFHKILKYPYNYLFLTIFIIFIGYQLRFIQDDAFISFRYAEHLVNGHGLTWNIGEAPVEGYTNFLWVLIMSVGAYLGFELIAWSMILSILAGFGTILVTYRLALYIMSDQSWALLAILLLGTNYTFLAYLTGGLETQLNTFLIVLSIYLAYKAVIQKKHLILIYLSLVFSLCILTRLDAILFLVPITIYLFWKFSQMEFSRKDIIIRLILLSAPFIAIIFIWLVFKLHYYGDILPNTFYVKIQGVILYGIQYIYIFAAEYAFLIFIPLFLFYFTKIISTRLMILLVSMIMFWLAYIIKLGGGFMEFRFFVPILPLICIICTVIIKFIADAKIRIAILFLLIASSTAHAFWFQGHSGMESIRSLNSAIYDKEYNWKGVGKLLGESFFKEDSNPVKIAVGPAGAIPYYSRLFTIDMLGLNDRWIAKNGIIVGKRQGHYKFTTLNYLFRREVNLVVGQPQVKPVNSDVNRNPQRFFNKKIDISALPLNSKIMEIPMDDEYKLEVLYIKKHPLIEDFIKEHGIRLFHVELSEKGI